MPTGNRPAPVADGGIRELVLKVTAGYIYWIDVAIWMFDLNDRYTMLAGIGVAA